MTTKKRLNVISDSENNSCSTDNLFSGAKELSSNIQAKDYGGTVAFVTLGCSKNMVDSEVMIGALQKRGYVPIDELADADLIVVNTCAFLESAVKEGIDTILQVSQYKEEGRCRKLIVCGCMVERYRDQLIETLPEVDLFISTDELLLIGSDVIDNSNAQKAVNAFDEARRPYFLYDDSSPRVVSTGSYSAYVKVAEGCDRPCAFCIIPKIRGSFRSRQINSVSKEVTGLLEQGIKEINFIAQDLTAFGSDYEGNRGIKSELPKLVHTVLQDNSMHDFWLRLYYAYPVGVTEELVKIIRDSPQICNYFDMPIQHISNSVLKLMNRPLGEKGTRNLVEQIKTIAPSLHLRTTFITGFPGETEEDVRLLEDYIKEGHFTHVGVFTYSQEKEAKSFTHANQVKKEVKDERRARLMMAQQESLSKRLNLLVGTSERAIFEGVHPESDMLYRARFSWQGPDGDGLTIVNDVPEDFEPASMEGQFVNIKITEVAGYDLIGEIIES